ncbi:MAG TPA: hypothetical protein VNJ03_01425 [Vicinamibacterales bacterium]|nr:hypothetical protein [Vicinamibacterales bacterium]
MSDHRICHLASEHANLEILELQDRVLDLEADLCIYRQIATAGIHALHRVTQERDRLRAVARARRSSARFDSQPAERRQAAA